MNAPGELAGFWSRLADLDEEIASTAADGCCVDALLEDRSEWMMERDELMARAGA